MFIIYYFIIVICSNYLKSLRVFNKINIFISIILYYSYLEIVFISCVLYICIYICMKYINAINFVIASGSFYVKYNRCIGQSSLPKALHHYEVVMRVHVILYPDNTEYRNTSFRSVNCGLLRIRFVHPFRNGEIAAIVVAYKFAEIV